MIDKGLLNYIQGKRNVLILVTLLSFFVLVFSVVTSVLTSLSIPRFIDGDKQAMFFLLGAGLSAIAFVLILFWKGKASASLADFVTLKIRTDIYQKYAALEGRSSFKVQEIAQLSSEGVEQLRLYYSVYLPSFFYAMIAPLALFVFFSFFSWKVALLYLICVPLIPVSIILVSRKAKKIFATYWNRYLTLGGAYLDAVSGMKELVIFNYGRTMREEMKNNSEAFRSITMKVLVMQLFSTAIMDFVAYGGTAAGIVLTLISLSEGAFDYPVAIFLCLIGAEFFLPMRALGSAFHVAMNGATAGKKVLQLIQEKELIDGTERVEKISSIALKDVSYRFEDGTEDTIKHVSFSIGKGFYALIGSSGSGKSTLAKLLTHQLNGYSGQVLIEGKELSCLNREDYRNHYLFLSSESFLLHLSIRDGFRFYAPQLKENEMLASLDKVYLKERILDSGGLDYVPKEGAEDLSGGEKQRLLLAYYLNVERDFCLFDETTSNIDKESEAIIVKTMEELGKDHIVLFISHRLSNTLNAKKIIALDDKGNLSSFLSPSEMLSIVPEFAKRVEEEHKWEAAL